MKKIFTLIFCLFIVGQDASGNIHPANLGASYIDDPEGLLTVLNGLAPQYVFNRMGDYRPLRGIWNGAIDQKIYGLEAQKSIVQKAIAHFEHGAKNIKTVRDGNASWLLSISNWWHHGRWFNPWSGNAAVANMEPNDFISNNEQRQPLTQKIGLLQDQINAWKDAKYNTAKAYDQIYSNFYDLQRIYQEGPKNDQDRRELKRTLERLRDIKEPIETVLINNQDPAIQTKLQENATRLGDQDRYNDQYSKVWWETWIGNRNLGAQRMLTLLERTGRNIFKLLPGSKTNYSTLAALGYVGLAGWGTYYCTKKYGKKGLAGSLGALALLGLIANSYCNHVVPGP